MQCFPSLSEFKSLAQSSRLVPVYRQLMADWLTPVSAAYLLGLEEGSFLFESVIGGERVGRYSFLGNRPFLQVSARGNEFSITRDGTLTTREVSDPLAELQRLLDEYPAASFPGLPPFCGGAVGYLGYDAIRYTEHLPNVPHDDRQLPDMVFGFHDRMIIFDHIRKTILLVVHADVKQTSPEKAYEEAIRRIEECSLLLSRPADQLKLTDLDLTCEPDSDAYSPNMSRADYESAVQRAQEYIRAGDIFQVVPSQRFQRQTSATSIEIYRSLRVVNPSPFMFLLQYPGFSLIGSSPEIMVRVDDGEVTIRPLAGTRRRGKTDAEDRELEAELLADEKERSEHIMLVDLARNDVGRVASYGSVALSEVMKVERYSHVMHITSNVTGQLKEGLSAIDALRAGLPAGTVSGAPKVRAMEIIDELEPTKRGPYAGAVGYIDFAGNLDTCIALRTLVMQGNTVYIQVGAGVVAESDPASEYDETLSKARGMMKAIDIAESQVATH